MSDPRPAPGLTPWRMVIGLGLVSLAADMVADGGKAILGPFLGSLGASALVVGVVLGAAEAVSLVLRLVAGPLADRSGNHWSWTIVGYAMTAVCIPLLAIAPAVGGAGLAVAVALILLERAGKAVRSPSKTALLAHAAGAYVADLVSTAQRPEQELRAFARVRLEPGQTRVVELELGHRAFATWSVAAHRWVVEGGEFELRVGASSRDVRRTAVVVLAGDDGVLPLAAETTAEAWLAHPEGGPWLRDALGDGEFAALLADPRNGQMMRAIPLQRLSRMPGFPVTEGDVDAAVEQFGPGAVVAGS